MGVWVVIGGRASIYGQAAGAWSMKAGADDIVIVVRRRELGVGSGVVWYSWR